MDYKSLVLELRSKGILVGTEETGFELNPYLEMPRSLGFGDVALGQEYNEQKSRLSVDISSEVFRGVRLDVPLLAANMSSVVNADFCIKLYKLGALGILHRAWPNEEDYLEEVKRVSSQCNLTAASIGAGPDQVRLADKLVSSGANIINLDIAQGFSSYVIETGRRVKENHPDIKLIVGNAINPEIMYHVDSFADAVKAGIAQGSVCRTKNTAGATAKQWSVVYNFKRISKKLGLPVISDGGIKEPADVVKAVGAGANSVMMGRVFARCPESAAEIVDDDGTLKKLYFGMASRESQNRWKGGLKPGTCPEGKTDYIPLGEGVEKLLERYSGALRSGFTYVGAGTIEEFQNKVRFIRL